MVYSHQGERSQNSHHSYRAVLGTDKLESNLQRLRDNLYSLEDNLKLFSLHNNTEIRQQAFESQMVGKRKAELDMMKGRINALLRTEKDRLKELHDAVAMAKESMRSASEKKQAKKVKRKKAKEAAMQSDLNKFKVQSQRHNDILSLVEAKQGLWDFNRFAHNEAKKDDDEQKEKKREKDTQHNIRNMKNVIKAKIYELASVQSNKNQLLLRKVEVSKRLKKKKQQNIQEFEKANVLLSYSVDVEQAIKANIEMANQLKEYYERACSAIKKGHDVDFEEEPEVVAEQLGVQFHQVALPSDIKLNGKVNKLKPITGLSNSPGRFMRSNTESESELPPPKRNFDSKSTDRKPKGIYSGNPGKRSPQNKPKTVIRKRSPVPEANQPVDIRIEDIDLGDACGVRIEKKSAIGVSVKHKDPFQVMASLESPAKKDQRKLHSPLTDKIEEESRYNNIGSQLSHDEGNPAQKFYMRGSDGFERNRGKKRRSSAHE